MISKQNIAILAAAAALSLNLTACSKQNTELQTDYAAKKASAETLTDQINTSMTTMKSAEDQWVATLTTASAKHGADTATINKLKSTIIKHETDADSINALMDSTKAYMNATPDQSADVFKNADDQLGTHFNDLSDKWKSYQDTQTSLAQQMLAYSSAGTNNVTSDSTTEKAEKVEKEAKKEAPKPKVEAPKPAMHTHPGVQRKSAN